MTGELAFVISEACHCSGASREVMRAKRAS